MKASMLFIVAMMIIAMSLSSLAQPTTPVTPAAPAATVAATPAIAATPAPKIEKKIWGLFFSREVYDSLEKKYAAFSDSDEVRQTWGEKREYEKFSNDRTLRNGDGRFVNMPKMFKRQVMNDVSAKFDSVTTNTKVAAVKADVAIQNANAVAANLDRLDKATGAELKKLGDDIDNISYFVRGQDEEIAQLQSVVSEDETLVPIPEEIRVVTRGATMEAKDAAMELIKLRVAARRAEAAKRK